MSASWTILALTSTAISAGINTLDAHFLVRRMPSLRAYILIIEVFLLPVSLIMLAVFPLPAGLGFLPLAMVFLAAVVSALASLILLDAMQREDVARIMPLIGTSPVFVAFLAWAFLGEALAPLQWLAVVVVVAGAVLISLKRQGGAHRFHASSFFVLLGAALLYAVSNVASKYALGHMSYWNTVSLMFLISSLVFLAYCLRPRVVREVRQLRPLVNLAVTANQAVAMVSTVLGYMAIQLGPVALVATTLNAKPLFIFVYSLLLGRLRPGFLLDNAAERTSLGLRLLATAMIVGGVGLVVLT